MRAAVITMGYLAVLLATPALVGCDRSPQLSAAPYSASGTVDARAAAQDADETVGGASIVADTTFSSTAQVARTATPSAGASEDRLMSDEPTSAGLPLDAPPSVSQEILKAADRRFLAAAGDSGAYDLALARLGFDKAKEPEIKLFAERLMTHHQQTNNTLLRLAASQGIEMAGSLPADRQAMIDQLAQASGNEFDARLLDMLGVRAQKADIALYEKAVHDVESPGLRDFAQATLPSIRRHLRSAQSLQQAQAKAQTANPMP